MKANELRIGNWVYSTSHKQNVRIKLLDIDREILNTEPIPLTEEWLLKFGFVLREESFHKFPTVRDTFDKTRIVERIDKKYFIYDEDVDDWRTFCAEVILDPKTLKIRAIGVSEIKNKFIVAGNIESVHQLQNLFFALTGEELEIKKVNE